jgi:hypothetical protein
VEASGVTYFEVNGEGVDTADAWDPEQVLDIIALEEPW